ncbi:macro domain-containing protein [Dactylosporangium sp. NPDC048998]|uniref:macro domain-containing protein n=1 Tax=Dactylosporangium sp. NPDC048998 TaxID=3363976 RepID=UPI00371036AC
MDREADIATMVAAVRSLDDLARALDRLRLMASRHGSRPTSLRAIARGVHKSPSTIQPYLNGQRLCPHEVYLDILRLLGVPADQRRLWLAAWERVADAQAGRARREQGPSEVRGSRPIHSTDVYRYRVDGGAVVGIVTGDVRRIRFIDVWINSENTEMKMARVDDFSISAVIRFEGSARDETGRPVEDLIADELTAKVAGRTPLPPCAAVLTGAGRLRDSNGVRYVVHVAAVQGEPGEGYRQVRGIGRGLLNALAEVARLEDPEPPPLSVLVPLLGTGVGGGDQRATVSALTGAAVDYLTRGRFPAASGRHEVREIYFLAYSEAELALFRDELGRFPRLVADAPS